MRSDARPAVVAIFFLLVGSLVPAAGFADRASGRQVLPRSPNPILEFSEEQAALYVERFIASPPPAGEWEDITLLAASRPNVVAPLLLARIERGRKSGMPPDEIKPLAHVLAFAGEDKAVEGLAGLTLADHDRFMPFLLEALGYAFDRGDGFSMAFLAARRSEQIDHGLASWLASHVGEEKDADSLLRAVITWRGAEHIEETLATEPLLSELPLAARERVKAAVAARSQRQ